MIDILLATYQGEAYLEEQLQSILRQTCQDWRLYISDDCSKDGTRAIAEAYAAQYPERITLLTRTKPSGSSAANFCSMLLVSTGDYIMFCDQDDVWDEDKLAVTLAKMQELEQGESDVPVLVHTDLRIVDEQLRVLQPSMEAWQKLQGSSRSFATQLVQNGITGCTMMMNRALLLRYRPAEGMIMHDWWFGLIAHAFGKVGYLSAATISYRQHGGNVEGAKDYSSLSGVLKIAKRSERIRQSIEKTYVQAESFRSCYEAELPEEARSILAQYCGMKTCGFVARRVRMFRYGFWKSGIGRKLGQLVYG